MTDPFDAFLLGKRDLIHDRATTYTPKSDGMLKSRGVEPLLSPPRSPESHAHCERLVCSFKEALNQMIIPGERAYVIHQYLTHYHTARNHQGLDSRLITPERVGCQMGHVVRRDRLGRLLNYWHRGAAWRSAVWQPYAPSVIACLA